METRDIIISILAIVFIVYVLVRISINGYFAKKQAFMDYTLQKAKELKYGTSEEKEWKK